MNPHRIVLFVHNSHLTDTIRIVAIKMKRPTHKTYRRTKKKKTKFVSEPIYALNMFVSCPKNIFNQIFIYLTRWRSAEFRYVVSIASANLCTILSMMMLTIIFFRILITPNNTRNCHRLPSGRKYYQRMVRLAWGQTIVCTYDVHLRF